MGAFATSVGAACVRWYGHGWPAVLAVVLLGLGTTAALWVALVVALGSAVPRGDGTRPTGRRVAVSKVTMQSRSATCSDDAPVHDIGAR
jgi:hypothetical protein